jgi:hypothetical protein
MAQAASVVSRVLVSNLVPFIRGTWSRLVFRRKK